MFKHILVPLDGSHLAEAALPAAAYLAQALGSTVTLFHGIERKAPGQIHGQHHLTGLQEALTYLDDAAARTFPPGMHVEKHVHSNEVDNVARSIAEHAGELEADLIVMCAHGQGGLYSWLFGHIALQVIALDTPPILIIQPTEQEEAPVFNCQTLLVPLDGNPDHEHGVSVAADLARACGAALHLVVVVRTFGTLSGVDTATSRFLPGTTRALLDQAEQAAEDYLGRQISSLKNEGLKVTGNVRRGEPTTAIVHTAARVEADLIVLGTHGKVGMDAFWSGSVTPRVSCRSGLPLLLVRV